MKEIVCLASIFFFHYLVISNRPQCSVVVLKFEKICHLEDGHVFVIACQNMIMEVSVNNLRTEEMWL